MTKRTMTAGLLLVLGCGGSAAATQETTTGEGTTGSDQATTPEAHVAWADMDMEARGHYMHDVVVPAMDPLFRPYHPDFGCKTCHGEDMLELQFDMPNTVTALDPAHMPFESEDPQQRQAAQFMAEQVMPRMAELLGQPPYDPETHQGFGCFGCHAMASSEAAASPTTP